MTEIQTDFPDIAKVYSIGKTRNGEDINILELTSEASVKSIPDVTFVHTKDDSKSEETEGKPSILITAATHARELISTTTNLYEALKLIKQGYIEQEPEMANLLKQNKYYFLPVLNVDGV